MALIKSCRGIEPQFGEDVFLAENATVVGDVVMGDRCSVWFNAVIRGDVNSILMGNQVNVQDGAVIHAVYACPFHADAQDDRYRHPDHPDRKPNPGMLLRAIADHQIDPARSFMIGDQQTDMAAARAAGVSGFLFEGGDLDVFVKELLGG